MASKLVVHSWHFLPLLAFAALLASCGSTHMGGSAPDDVAVTPPEDAGVTQPDDASRPPADVEPVKCDSDADCDDGDDCTSNICTWDGTCDHPAKAGFCHIDGVCFEAGAAHPDEPCLACLPLLVSDDWSPDDTLTCGEDGLCETWSCHAGLCVPTPNICDDGNPCTVGRCDPAAGCIHEPRPGSCDDGNVCTLGDRCIDGVCASGEDQLPCDDGNPCTSATCDPALGCKYTFLAGECDDGDACTKGTHCVEGVCVSSETLSCDDGNPCTDGWCHPLHGCLYADNSAPCDDGDPCTIGDRCVGRVCTPGPDLLTCDNGNLCTDDVCVPGEGCISVPNTAPCDDGNVCTTGDVCTDGECTPTGTLDCDEGALCMAYGCDPVDGCWSDPLSGMPCDDGRVCTVDNTCFEGACIGTPLPCDDGNDCTIDRCVEPIGCRSTLEQGDACGLQLVITDPPRGVTLDERWLSAGGIPVRGYLDSPADPAPQLLLNGLVVELTAEPPADPPGLGEPNPGIPKRFSFDVVVEPEHAMNLLQAEATDGYGQEANRTQSFYYSTVWNPVTAADFLASRIEAGITLGLSQEFVDDGEPTVDDLASLVSLLISSIDLMDAIPSPGPELSALGCRYELEITDAQYESVHTTLRITDDGLALDIWLYNFRMDFNLIKLGGLFCPGNQTGHATADAVWVSAQIVVSVENGEVQAVLDPDSLTVELINLEVSVNSWFTNLILSMFQGTIRSMLEDQLKDVIQDQIEPLLASLFDALLIQVDIDIPPLFPGGSAATVALRTRVASIEFVSEESMTIEMDAAVMAEQGVPYHVLGALGYANCLLSPFTRNWVDFGLYERINLGLFDDVANQILHAAWHTGAFELTLGDDLIPADQLDQFGLSDVIADVSMLLPPVLTACKETSSLDTPDALMLELGDMQVEASLLLNGAPIELLLYASLRGAADLGVATNDNGETEIGITILGFDEVYTDLVYVDAPDPMTANLAETLIETALVPLLLEQFNTAGTIGFPLPTIDLSNPEAGIPEGTGLRIIPLEVFQSDNGNTIMKGTVVQAD